MAAKLLKTTLLAFGRINYAPDGENCTKIGDFIIQIFKNM